MTIHSFSTGAVRGKRGERGARRYLPGGWREDTEPVYVFAVEHERGICLFDAGQCAEAAAPGYFPAWHPFFRLARFELERRDEAAEQLRRAGLDAGDVRWVVLSHLHTDHVGGLGAFRGADVLVAAEEWRRATGARGRLRGYVPQHWPRGLEPTLVEFHRSPLGPFSGSYDLADDGRLVLVPTPGHTPGHMSLLVDHGERRFLLAGDAAHTAAELAVAEPAIGDYCRRAGIVVLATHDPHVHELLHETTPNATVGGG